MSKLTLLRNPDSNNFCVPAAVALISGRHVDEIISMIREDLGDQPTGLFYPMGLKYLQKLGFKYERVNHFKHLDATATYYLIIPRHAAVIHEGLYYDNANPNGIEFKMSKFAVDSLWRVYKDAA